MQEVFIYFNLHKKLFSLKDWKTKRVTGHADTFILQDVEFKVSAKGRARVLREKCKNVHAGLRGKVIVTNSFQPTWFFENNKDFVELTYNPYKYDSFVVKSTGQPITHAHKVIGIGRRLFAEVYSVGA